MVKFNTLKSIDNFGSDSSLFKCLIIGESMKTNRNVQILILGMIQLDYFKTIFMHIIVILLI